MKIDILAPAEASTEVVTNRYDTDALEAAIDMANDTYDLVDNVYLDDKKVNAADLPDIVVGGPRLISSAQRAITKAGELADEVFDLSEAEKARLRERAGKRLNDPSYAKIFAGSLEIIDGVAEKLNAGNPVD